MTLGGYLMISDAPNSGVTFMIVLYDTSYSCDTISTGVIHADRHMLIIIYS